MTRWRILCAPLLRGDLDVRGATFSAAGSLLGGGYHSDRNAVHSRRGAHNFRAEIGRNRTGRCRRRAIIAAIWREHSDVRSRRICARRNLPGLAAQRNAYRYAGVTLAVVMLVARANSSWDVAMHRFIEVSIGIAIGLLLTAVWPERISDE